MKYTNLDEVTDYLGKDVDSEYNTRINRWIDAMSRYIDKETNHFPLVYDGDVTAVIRKYDGKGGNEVFIDDIVQDKITSLKVNDSAVTDFEISSNYGDGGYMLYIPSGALKGRKNIEVTGQFGKFLLVPDDIAFACTVLVVGILNHSLNEQQEVRSETIGRYTVSYGSARDSNDFKIAMGIIQDFRKINVM